MSTGIKKLEVLLTTDNDVVTPVWRVLARDWNHPDEWVQAQVQLTSPPDVLYKVIDCKEWLYLITTLIQDVFRSYFWLR